MTRRLLLGTLAALSVAAPAQAATQNLSATRAVDRDCTSRAFPKRAGLTSTRFVAPADGTLRARLAGRGDWDLAAFDSARNLVAGSSAFRSNELVEVHLRKGAVIRLQACRVGGKSRSVKLTTDFAKVDFDALRQTGKVMLVEVPVKAPWQIGFLERLGLDVTHDVHDGHARVMLYGDRDRELLLKTGLGFDVVHADVTAVERRFRAADRRAVEAPGASPLPTGREEYRTFEEVQQELKDMVAQHPDLVRPFNLPEKTFQGRDIQAVEIASGVNSDDDTRPVLFLNGIHHAREWPATEVIMEFAWDLLKNNGSDAQLGQILREVRVVVQPYTNVDGFIVSRGAPDPGFDDYSDEQYVYTTTTGVVLLGGSFGYKRKNCNPYPLAGPQPCQINVGTDNNRNYPHTWGGNGSSTNPNDQGYRGEAPGSEPETAAVQLQQLGMNAPVLISMHNIAAKVLRPPGTEAEGFSPDEEGLKELGRRMAEPAGYKNEYGWQLYDVTGGTKDWAYAVTGAYGYTVETGPDDGDFHGEYQEVVIDQYLGSGDLAGRGMREALIQAALWTRNEQYTSRIAGRAPAGRTLRITKNLTTLTSPVCTVGGINPLSIPENDPTECVAPGEVLEVPEKMEIVTKVPASGRFTWWVNPSTRPYSKSPESYHLTCEQDGAVLEEFDVVVGRGETFTRDIPCGGTLPSEGSAPPVSAPPAGAPAVGLKLGKVKRAGRKVRVGLVATGTLQNVRVRLVKGRKSLGTAKVSSLTGTRTVVIKSRKKLRKGRYSVVASATGVKATSKRFKVR